MPRILGIDVGLRNLAVCAVDVEEETFTVRQWAVLDVLKEKKAKQVTIEESVSLMLNALGERPALFEGVELVAIESQPVGRVVSANVRMKVVSHCIQSFVALKTDCKCCFVNPKSKLTQELVRKMCGEQDEEGGDANSKKSAIRSTKKWRWRRSARRWQRSGPSSGTVLAQRRMTRRTRCCWHWLPGAPKKKTRAKKRKRKETAAAPSNETLEEVI